MFDATKSLELNDFLQWNKISFSQSKNWLGLFQRNISLIRQNFFLCVVITSIYFVVVYIFITNLLASDVTDSEFSGVGPEALKHIFCLWWNNRRGSECRHFLNRDTPFDRHEGENPFSEGQRLLVCLRRLEAKERRRQERDEDAKGKDRKERRREKRKRRLGGEQMEVGESRNKRYVNPRNGAVYSSHKKANKTFFRSGRYTPLVLLYPLRASATVTPAQLLLTPGKMTENKSPLG